jgi:uncharacterized protein YndB with AHSA1/START domain
MTTDATLDLVLERYVAVPVEKVWAAWTQPDLLIQWFVPAPWKAVHAEVDLRPGGAFHTVMQSPEGQQFPGTGCYLEVEAPTRLVWTSVLAGGYRPNVPGATGPDFTGILTFTRQGSGTLYRAEARHGTAEAAKAHADMGFHDGWGKALDQLVGLMG